MWARFIGDPAEREGGHGKPLSRPAGDWFEVPAGREAKYRGNSHYEVREHPPEHQATPAPVRRRRSPSQTEAEGIE